MHKFQQDEGSYSMTYKSKPQRAIGLDMSVYENTSCDIFNLRNYKSKYPSILLFAIKHFEDIEENEDCHILQLKQ